VQEATTKRAAYSPLPPAGVPTSLAHEEGDTTRRGQRGHMVADGLHLVLGWLDTPSTAARTGPRRWAVSYSG
jgi:hypothetical protein